MTKLLCTCIQVVLPALHITLGVFYRLFSLLENQCYQLDLQHALMKTTPPTVQLYTVFFEALKRVHALREKIGRLKEESDLLDQLVSFLVQGRRQNFFLKGVNFEM